MKKRWNRKDTLDTYSTEFREMFSYQASLFFYDALRWGSTSYRSKKSGGALRRSDRTCSTFTQKRLLLGLRYSWKEREWWANFIKVKVKLSIGDRIGDKKYKKNDKTLTNKHFILKIVPRLTTLCLNNTWYFGWGTPSFTIFDSYLICWLHWEKKYIIPARSLVEISESAYRVYRS